MKDGERRQKNREEWILFVKWATVFQKTLEPRGNK
jgi:hypothetical protein